MMPKNQDKYRYLNVGLGWDSWVLAKLLEDAEMHQMADQPAKLAALRLTEYYRLVERGIIEPGVTILSKKEEADGADLQETMSIPISKKDISKAVVSESATTRSNASAALHAFLDEEDS
jgi:hypothetical protein